jgi:hypothetical protein
MFAPIHVVRQHAFQLPIPAPRALQLFTPEGEKAWVPNWNPRFLHPSDGAPEIGAVFVTQSDSDTSETIWLVLEHDRSVGQLSYARISPTSRLARVDVSVTAESDRSCRVCVAYEYTALSEAGNTYLMGFTQEYFRSYIDSWRVLILEHLDRESAGC